MNNEDSIFYRLLKRKDFVEGQAWRRVGFETNQIIVKEGELSGKIFLILSGTTRILGDIDLGSDRRIRPGFDDLGPGNVFGELTMLDDHPHSNTVTAITTCELAEIDSGALVKYLDNNPALGYDFFKSLSKILARRFRKTNKKVLSLFAWGLKAHEYQDHLK